MPPSILLIYLNKIKKMRTLLTVTLCFVFLSAVPLAANAQWWAGGMKGEGPQVVKTLDVDNFKGITLAFSATVYLTQGDTYSVKVEGQENIIDNIETEVRDGHWKIKFDENVGRHDKLTLWITMPTLNKAAISGSGALKGETVFRDLNEVDVSISGSGDIQLELEANSVNTRISGSGDIRLRGSATAHRVKISGSGDVDTVDLRSQETSVRISGSGDCRVHAEESLEVSTSGSGDVYYSGRPRVSAKVSGSGEVQPVRNN